MAAARLSTETIFLREFARFYVQDISFAPEALRYIEESPALGLGDAMYVLRKGHVRKSNKDDADGARWLVSGKTCDDKEMVLNLKVWVDRYFIRVLSISIRESE